MARAAKYPATVVGFSERRDGTVEFVQVAFYVPKSKHVNVEFLRPGFQVPAKSKWGDRGFVQYSGGLYYFARNEKPNALRQ